MNWRLRWCLVGYWKVPESFRYFLKKKAKPEVQAISPCGPRSAVTAGVLSRGNSREGVPNLRLEGLAWQQYPIQRGGADRERPDAAFRESSDPLR